MPPSKTKANASAPLKKAIIEPCKMSEDHKIVKVVCKPAPLQQQKAANATAQEDMPCAKEQPSMSLNQKFVEMIAYLLAEQNRQLIEIISENEMLPLEELQFKYLNTKSDIYADVCRFARASKGDIQS